MYTLMFEKGGQLLGHRLHLQPIVWELGSEESPSMPHLPGWAPAPAYCLCLHFCLVLELALAKRTPPKCCYFLKPMECTKTRVNANGNYGVWEIRTCPYRLTYHNKCTALVGIVNRRGGFKCRDGEALWELYTFHSILL